MMRLVLNLAFQKYNHQYCLTHTVVSIMYETVSNLALGLASFGHNNCFYITKEYDDYVLKLDIL